MSNIKISDLSPAGSEFFLGSESYMNEIGDSELDTINGGGWGKLLFKAAQKAGQWAANASPRTPMVSISCF